MAVRSVIDIAVNDGAFRAFTQLFQRYQQTLPGTASVWRQVSTHVAATVGMMRPLQASSAAVASSWQRLSSYTSTVASSLKSATESLLRWTSLTSIVSGLLGIGSLFGLEHLARGVGQGRREAEGVGTTYGQQRAFELSYGRFVDPDVLGRISHAFSDPAKGFIFQGVSAGARSRGDSVEIAREMLPILTRFAKTTDERLLGTLAGAKGYLDIVSLETLKRLRRAGPGELEELGAGFGGLSRSLTRNQKTERAYQDFDKALEVSAENIRNAFVVGLAPAIPALTQLSETLGGLLKGLLTDAITPERVRTFGENIAEFTKEIGSPEFQERVHQFVVGVGEMADEVNRFVGGARGLIGGAKRAVTDVESKGLPNTLMDAILPKGFREKFQEHRQDVFNSQLIPSQYEAQAAWKNAKARIFDELGLGIVKPAPSIGGRSDAPRSNGISHGGILNETYNDLWVMVRAPNGGSTPRAAAQIGSSP